MKKGISNSQYILLGTGVALAIGFTVAGIVVFNKRKRQGEYDYLIKVINDNLDGITGATLKGGAFDRDIYKKNPQCATIDSLTAKQLSDKLLNAKGVLSDDVQAVESVFKNLNTKCDVSKIADHFYNAHGKADLFAYLKSFLNNDELEKYILFYTDKLK